MKLIQTYGLLIGIMLLAAGLRLWQLGVVPPSPDWDEAALGYNAYSILKTGKDEYGTPYPLTLRSFDDYKPPLYAYLTIPSVAIFGLNIWSTRLPSAIMGILAVLGAYFLVRKLFDEGKNASVYALITSFLLAISPWHIQFSRIAFEANVGLTLNIWAIFFFLVGLRNGKALCLSAFLFGLGLYAYHSERIFVPLIVLLLTILYRKELWSVRKYVGTGIIVGLITIAPLIPVLFDKTTLMRLRGTSSLSDQTGLLAKTVEKLEEDRRNNNPWGAIFDNRRIVWVRTIADGYLAHYSLRWLFLTGDNDRHHAPGMGLLYVWELPFLLYGLYRILTSKYRSSKLLLGWFLFAPIPASPTSETPHAIRSLVFLPTFQIFIAYGIVQTVIWLRTIVFDAHKRKSIVRPLLAISAALYVLFIVFQIGQYIDLYFVHQNHEYSRNWQYGYKEAVWYAEAHRSRYKKIVVSTSLEQPHMFFLFYLRYDPAKYLAEGGTSSGGFAEDRNRFDIYEFRPIVWGEESHDGSVLYIGTQSEIQEPIYTVNYLDGLIGIRMGE